MKAIKKINNNTAVCLDADNHELIAIGRGVGFPEMPYEISDMKQVERTFYDVDSMYIDLASQIPETVLNVAIKIVDMVRLQITEPVSSNLVFTLADHVNFAIERRKKGIVITAPLQYDVQNLYTDEYNLGLRALKIVNQDLKVRLPEEEATNLALHFINAETVTVKQLENQDNNTLINRITEIISGYFNLYIDKHSFNYSRFATHLQYLLKRQSRGQGIKTENNVMYQEMVKQFPDTDKCVQKISLFLNDEANMQLSDEEKLYLMLHVNRLCSREDL
ncbi:PRD domain-containing protein [Lactiplantibacillus pingfangensis]|uniref:PRD domain-containing protein n=1 Tax=Lactiplantibacillus pingfangensis TaxID=2559915 RepID=UPI0010F9A881|nr:PRD domain-containing protein [Lactiplantibacillus pingfangensis]